MTEREFAECVALLCASVGKEMTLEQSKAWYAMLGDLRVEQLKAGIIATIRSYTFAGFPPIGVIRDNCGAKSGTIATKDRPTLAWGEVRRQISRCGYMDSPKFDDQIIHATIRQLGGWVALCDSTSEDLVWREKDFLRTYAALMPLNLPDEQTVRLAGEAERVNGPAFPVNVVEIGCLTTGTHGERRRIEEPETKRISGPSPAAEILAKRLDFDDRESSVVSDKPAQARSREDQLSLLKAMA